MNGYVLVFGQQLLWIQHLCYCCLSFGFYWSTLFLFVFWIFIIIVFVILLFVIVICYCLCLSYFRYYCYWFVDIIFSPSPPPSNYLYLSHRVNETFCWHRSLFLLLIGCSAFVVALFLFGIILRISGFVMNIDITIGDTHVILCFAVIFISRTVINVIVILRLVCLH